MSKRKKPSKRRSPAPTGAHKAFLGAVGHTLFGKKLQPYTPSRVVAAQAMGLLYPNIGPGGAVQLKKTGLYPGELQDILIVLWLCLREKPEEIEKARMDPIAAYGVAEKWGAKAGIIGLCDPANERFTEALLIFQLIMTEIGESKTKPVETGSRRGSHGDEEEDNPND